MILKLLDKQDHIELLLAVTYEKSQEMYQLNVLLFVIFDMILAVSQLIRVII